MSNPFMERHTEVFAAAVISSTGDKATFTPARPVDIIRWGFVADVTTSGTTPVIALDKRPTAGSNTGRVDAAGDTITATGHAAGGKGFYNEDVKLALKVGEQAVIEVTTAASAGSAIFFIEFLERPFVSAAELANMTKATV